MGEAPRINRVRFLLCGMCHNGTILAQWSLSRLNRWLPRRARHPEVVQGPAQCHHEIADALLPQADPVFDDAPALHTAVDLLNPSPATVQGLVGPLLLPWQCLAAGFLRRHEDLHLRERAREKAQILPPPAPGREGSRAGLGQPLVMEAASSRLAEAEDEEQRLAQQEILYRMVLFLAALTRGLFSRSVPSGAQGGRPARRLGRWSRGLAPPAGRPRRPPRPPKRRSATPGPSENGWGHRRGHATPPAARGGGRASTDALCSGPCRTGAPGPLGAQRF